MASELVSQEAISEPGYSMGHSQATTRTHEARTVQTDASFLIPHIKPHHHILDVGCGPGTITVGFGPFVSDGRVIGVDYSPEVVERARSLAMTANASDNITFIQGNLLDKLPFDDESFDIVFASQVFGHLQPQENAIKTLVECKRVLKPDGILAVRDAAFMSWYPYTAELDRIFTKNLWKSIGGEHFGGFHMRAWLRDAAFDVENEAKVKISGGSDVYANRALCQWRCDSLVARLAKGEKFRDSWLKASIPDEECDEAIELLTKWAASDDAFYGILQTEVLARK